MLRDELEGSLDDSRFDIVEKMDAFVFDLRFRGERLGIRVFLSFRCAYCICVLVKMILVFRVPVSESLICVYMWSQ